MLLIYMVVLTESHNKKWLDGIFIQRDDFLQICQLRLPSVTLVLSDPLIIGIKKVPQKHTIL